MKAEDYEHYEDDLWNLEEQDKRTYSEINGTGLKRKQGDARPQPKTSRPKLQRPMTMLELG